MPAIQHACYPALTIIPNLATTGFLAIVIGLTLAVWAVAYIRYDYGGLSLILLSGLMLATGGGFVPVFIGLVAGAAACSYWIRPNCWKILSLRPLSVLAKLWPWTLLLLTVWFPCGWLLGHFFPQAMLQAGVLLLLCCNIGLPLMAVITGFAYDTQRIFQ
jgi:hypothetical protein